MARTNLPLHTLVANSGVVSPSTTAIDQTNGMNVAVEYDAIPAAPGMDHLLLVVSNTFTSSENVIIRAGVGGGATPGAAFRSGEGDLTVAVAASSTAYLGPFESARFTQLDGSLNIDFSAGITGTILALVLPQRF